MSSRAEALGRVDDQVRERGLEQADHADQVVGRDVARVFQLHGPRQQVQAGVVLRERALEQREVEPGDVLGDVGERVVGNRVEEDVGVAQAQVEVEQDDGVFFVRRRARSRGSRPGSCVPTPPVAPVTAITVQPCCLLARAAVPLASDALQARRPGLRS